MLRSVNKPPICVNVPEGGDRQSVIYMTEQDRFIRGHPTMFTERYLVQSRRKTQKEEREGINVRIQDFAVKADHFPLVNVPEEQAGSGTAGNGFS